MSRAVFGSLAAAIVALAAALRFTALGFGLPNLYARPDEFEVVQLSARVAGGVFALDWSAYPHAYLYLQWLWSALGLAVLQLVGAVEPGTYAEVYQREPELFHLLGRTLAAASGTLAVLVVILAARRSLGSGAALVAGLVLATNLLHVRESHAAKPDALLSLGIALGLAAAVPLGRRATWRTGALAGLAAGFATAAKYNGILLLVPAALAAWQGSPPRGRWRAAAIATAAAVLACLATAALCSPLLFSQEGSVRMLVGFTAMIFPDVLELQPAFESNFPELAARLGLVDLAGARAAVEAIVGAEPGGPAWRYHAEVSLRHGMGLAAAVASPFAVAFGLFSRRPLAVAAAAFAAVHAVAVLLGSGLLFSRWFTPAVPALAIALAALAAWLAERAGRFGETARRAGLLASGLLLCAEPLASSLALDRTLARSDTRVLATRWLEAEVPAGARIAVLGTRFFGWGAPAIPEGLVLVVGDRLRGRGPRAADYVIAHEHSLPWSKPDSELLAAIGPRLRLLVEFDPGTGRGGEALFERNDAWYVPIAGFEAVERPGPRIRIYAVR